MLGILDRCHSIAGIHHHIPLNAPFKDAGIINTDVGDVCGRPPVHIHTRCSGERKAKGATIELWNVEVLSRLVDTFCAVQDRQRSDCHFFFSPPFLPLSPSRCQSVPLPFPLFTTAVPLLRVLTLQGCHSHGVLTGSVHLPGMYSFKSRLLKWWLSWSTLFG